MSGIAIIIEGADFSSLNLGKVSRLGETPAVVELKSITIKGPTEIAKDSATAFFSASLDPVDTTQKNVVWSSDDESVIKFEDSHIGNAAVVHGDAQKSVVVTCKSVDNELIYNTLTVTVEANVQAVPITGLQISVPENIEPDVTSLQAIATLTPSNTTQKDLVWSSDNTDVIAFNADNSGTATVTHLETPKTVNVRADSKFNANVISGTDVNVTAKGLFKVAFPNVSGSIASYKCFASNCNFICEAPVAGASYKYPMYADSANKSIRVKIWVESSLDKTLYEELVAKQKTSRETITCNRIITEEEIRALDFMPFVITKSMIGAVVTLKLPDEYEASLALTVCDDKLNTAAAQGPVLQRGWQQGTLTETITEDCFPKGYTYALVAPNIRRSDNEYIREEDLQEIIEETFLDVTLASQA